VLTPYCLQVDKLGMVGVNGGKFPAIREHLQQNIAGVYKDMDISYVHIHPDALLVSPTAIQVHRVP